MLLPRLDVVTTSWLSEMNWNEAQHEEHEHKRSAVRLGTAQVRCHCQPKCSEGSCRSQQRYEVIKPTRLAEAERGRLALAALSWTFSMLWSSCLFLWAPSAAACARLAWLGRLRATYPRESKTSWNSPKEKKFETTKKYIKLMAEHQVQCVQQYVC